MVVCMDGVSKLSISLNKSSRSTLVLLVSGAACGDAEDVIVVVGVAPKSKPRRSKRAFWLKKVPLNSVSYHANSERAENIF